MRARAAGRQTGKIAGRAMPLDEYRRKRDFTRTPEPDGSTPRRRSADDGLFFSVQKHLASHLHYDLRLEWNGVLLSWAIPKGPSIDPADKRLAMQTEDHPYDYGTFEGVIPEGYGAGIVMLWDRGTWTPESPDVDAALRKGDLKFTLDGFKLKGSWALIRTRGFGSGSKPSWLLIKHRDEWAGPVNITEFAPLSVKTPDADFADILAADNPDIWHSNAPARTGDTGKLFARIIAQAVAMKTGRGRPPEPEAAAPVKPAARKRNSTSRATPEAHAKKMQARPAAKSRAAKAPGARAAAARKRR
jgi:bifunctional non-homologous end joining protein LigD